MKKDKNKMVTGKTKGVNKKYHFPTYGVTVEASSIEEAEKKVKKLNSNK